jgi:type III pantothenate kinase
MNLVIDIGNTHTKTARFEKSILLETQRFENSAGLDLTAIIDGNRPDNCIISSVGPVDQIDHLNEDKSYTVVVLDHSTPLPLGISYKTPETLGHDRIAGAAGAKYVCPFCNVMIMDMGTAITIDFVNAEGIYMGGNISPGLQTRFRSLHDYTARLPLMSKEPGFPEFGNDTPSAIVAGVQQGIIYELNSYIEEYSRRYPACEFIITGGDADFFVNRLKKPIFVIPELVLKGLNYILDYNVSGKKI